MRLSRRFTLAFIAAGLLPLFGLALIAYDFTNRAVTDQVSDQLRGIARVQRNRIKLLYRLKRDQLGLISTRTRLRSCLSEYDVKPDDQLVQQMVEILLDARDDGEDMLSVLSVDGDVIASTDVDLHGQRPPDSPNLLRLATADAVFGKVFLDGAYRACVDMYGPLFDRKDEVIGIAWVRTHLNELESIANDYTGLGKTGETLLVMLDDKGKTVYLTRVRFDEEDKLRQSDDAEDSAGEPPYDPARIGTIQIDDYRGAQTISATEYSPDLDCGVIVKIDRSEAMATVQQFAQVATWTAVFASLGVVAVSLLLSNSITRPLKELTAAAAGFDDGDLSKQIAVSNQEEVDKLGEALIGMSERLLGARRDLEKEVSFRRSVVDSALDAVIAVNSNGRVTLWNPQAEVMFGLSEDEAIGKPFGDLINPTDATISMSDAMRQLMENQEESTLGGRVEYELRRIDGSIFDVEMAVSPMRIDDQDGYGVFAHETTDKKEAERQLQRANAELKKKNEEVRQLVYTVSHDLKAPLVTCKGFIEVMREDLERGDIDELADSMERIQRAAGRMDELIDDLLQISRIGSIAIRQEWIDVRKLVSSIVDEWQMQIEEAGVEIAIRDRMPMLWADPAQATTVFENLLANAIKYGTSERSPVIRIGGDQVGDQTRFYVADNGIGIAAEFHGKIFRLFQRLESTKPGSGIGLAAVARILEVHGGRAWVKSKKGQGATFWVAFPTPSRAEIISVWSRCG